MSRRFIGIQLLVFLIGGVWLAGKPLPLPTLESMAGSWVGIDNSGDAVILQLSGSRPDGALAFSRHEKSFVRWIQTVEYQNYKMKIELDAPIFDGGKRTLSGDVRHELIRINLGRGGRVVFRRKDAFLTDLSAAESILQVSNREESD